MRDNEMNKVDQGWRQMSAILDKEMPVERDRKPFFWIILFGLLLLAAAAGAWYFNRDDSSTPAADMPVAQTDHSNPSENGMQNGDVGNLSGDQQAVNTNGNSPESSVAENQNTVSAKGDGTDLSSKENALVTQEEAATSWTETPTADASKSVKSSAQLKENISDLNDGSPGITEGDEDSGNHTSIPLKNHVAELGFLTTGKLSALSAPYNSLKTLTLAEDPVEIVQKTEDGDRISIGLRIAGESSSFEALNGGSARAFVSLPISKKVSFNPGLSYRYHSIEGLSNLMHSTDNQSSGTVPTVVTQEDIINNFPGTSTQEYIGLEQVVWEDQLRELHYLSLPLLISWQPAGKFFLELGAAPAYLVDSKLETVYGAPTSFFSQNVIEFNASGPKHLNRWDIQLHGGLGYELGDRLALDFSYSHGLISVLETDFTNPVHAEGNRTVNLDKTPEPFYIRFFELGLRHRLN